MTMNTTQIRSESQSAKQSVLRFRRDDDGALILFGLLMFVLILWLGGMAVDLIRFETTRAKLQGTLDRATLAAADLDQTLDCEGVVNDYFDKAGMLTFLDDVDCDTGLNYKTVTASASADMPLFFYDIPRIFSEPFEPGLTTLNVSGVSVAEERVSDVEISLVLDVSTSMDSNGRITNLRSAAKEFVTTVLANNTNAPQGLITVSMVPYSAVVNVGPDIANAADSNGDPYLDINRTHSYSTCPQFDDDTVFETTVLDLDKSYDHVSHFIVGDPWCFVGEENAIIPMTSNEDMLHTAIDALTPFGNTAIDMGMKWGVGLLDPSTRDIITDLAATSDNSVEAPASGRPYAFSEPDVLKVVVLMTDGENTTQFDLIDRFKDGDSFVWFDLKDYDHDVQLSDVRDNDISIQYSGQLTPDDYTDDAFFWNGSSSSYPLYSYPRGYSSRSEYVDAMENGPIVVTMDGSEVTEEEYEDLEEDTSLHVGNSGNGPTFTDNVRKASWQELYANWEYNRINNELLYDAYNTKLNRNRILPYSAGTGWARPESGSSYQIYLPDYIDADYGVTGTVYSSDADDRLEDLCQAARDEQIVIYTVAFEAPTNGQTALRNCASSTSHYFDVDGKDITEAFSAIASDIRALKLTQ